MSAYPPLTANQSINGMTHEPLGGSSSGFGLNGTEIRGLFSAFGQAANAYYGAKVFNSQQKILSQRRAFDFQSSQIALKSSLLSDQHNLKMQQFELKAAAFALQAQAIQYQTQAMADEFKASMSELNARQAEREAQGILLQGERQIGQLTLAAGQAKSDTKASQAARGVVLGEGSAGETVASIDLIKESDALTINVNRTQGANQKRLEKVGFENEAQLARTSADANRLSAGFAQASSAIPNQLAGIAGRSAEQTGGIAANISTTDVPGFITRTPRINAGQAAFTSLLSTVTPVAAGWYARRRTMEGTASAVAGY